jgi:hypothetical protein
MIFYLSPISYLICAIATHWFMVRSRARSRGWLPGHFDTVVWWVTGFIEAFSRPSGTPCEGSLSEFADCTGLIGYKRIRATCWLRR